MPNDFIDFQNIWDFLKMFSTRDHCYLLNPEFIAQSLQFLVKSWPPGLCNMNMSINADFSLFFLRVSEIDR